MAPFWEYVDRVSNVTSLVNAGANLVSGIRSVYNSIYGRDTQLALASILINEGREILSELAAEDTRDFQGLTDDAAYKILNKLEKALRHCRDQLRETQLNVEVALSAPLQDRAERWKDLQADLDDLTERVRQCRKDILETSVHVAKMRKYRLAYQSAVQSQQNSPCLPATAELHKPLSPIDTYPMVTLAVPDAADANPITVDHGNTTHHPDDAISTSGSVPTGHMDFPLPPLPLPEISSRIPGEFTEPADPRFPGEMPVTADAP